MKITRILLAGALATILAFAFVGCNSNPTSGVAATVGEDEIQEADVSALIEYYRLDQETQAAMDDAAWATYVGSATIPTDWTEFFAAKGNTSETFTPELLREYVIRNNFAVFNLMVQKAAEKDITADQAELDTQMEQIRSSADSMGTTMEELVRSRGFATEAAYRKMLEAYDISQPLAETLVADPTEAEIDKYTRENISTFAGKRISLIALSVDEQNPEADQRAKIEKAKADLDAGGDWNTIVQTALPAGSELLATNGDIGWGYESSMPESVRTALAGLAKDQPSDIIEIVTDSAGTTDDPSDDTLSSLYIVKWTDEMVLPEGTQSADEVATVEGAEESEGAVINADLDLSFVPEDVKTEMADACKQQKITDEQQSFWIELAQSDEIVVNPMPEGLSYNVDMALAGTDTATDTPAEEVSELQSSDITEGTGAEAVSGSVVQVYYTGTLQDGTVFDSNVGGEPFEVTIDSSNVIQGWHDGLKGMKVGGTRQLIIPASLAYGDQANGDIPANSTLIFEIELVSVDGDSTGYTESSLQPSEEALDNAENAVE